MKRGMNKKSISPIIATVLLIILVIIIAVLIFMWARRFVGEACEKQGANAEIKCQEISLEASRSGTLLYIDNKGNVPIEKVRVKIIGEGSTSTEEIETKLSGGQSNSFDIASMDGAQSVSVVPILKGQTQLSACLNVCENIEFEALEM